MGCANGLSKRFMPFADRFNGLVRQVKGATNRDTAYEITEDGSRVSARLVAQRRELLMRPTSDMVELDRQLRSLALSLGLLTGVYDHGTRVLARRMGESSGQAS